MNRHLRALEFLDAEEDFLSDKVKDEYDFREISREKERIAALLQVKNKREIWWISAGVVLFLFIVLLLYRSYRLKSIYKQRFDALMKGHKPYGEVLTRKRELSRKPDISQEVVDKVLEQLDKFEKERKFLDNKMTLSKLAVILDVNSKYLSQIIAHFKGKGVVEYLNDLRIDYILDQMQKDRKLLHYSNRSLASEARFNSERTFYNAFRSRTGITPAFFLEQLRQSEKCSV